jgi:transcriptional regulator with XRE-family HTH domain
MNETALITVYCFVDEFINALMRYPLGTILREQWEGKRGPKKQLSLAEVITLNILRFYLRVHDLKTFHRLLENAYREYFPALPMMLEKKLSQKAIADIAGIRPPSVNEWKSKGTMPRADTAIKLADFFKVLIKWLVNGDNDEISQEERELLDAFCRLNDEGKDNAILLIKALVPKYPLPSEQAGASSKMAT